MKKKHFSYLIMFVAVAAFNVIAFASGANETEKYHEYPQTRSLKECYETWGDCGLSDKRYVTCTSEPGDKACTKYYCISCER